MEDVCVNITAVHYVQCSTRVMLRKCDENLKNISSTIKDISKRLLLDAAAEMVTLTGEQASASRHGLGTRILTSNPR